MCSFLFSCKGSGSSVCVGDVDFDGTEGMHTRLLPSVCLLEEDDDQTFRVFLGFLLVIEATPLQLDTAPSLRLIIATITITSLGCVPFSVDCTWSEEAVSAAGSFKEEEVPD